MCSLPAKGYLLPVPRGRGEVSWACFNKHRACFKSSEGGLLCVALEDLSSNRICDCVNASQLGQTFFFFSFLSPGIFDAAEGLDGDVIHDCLPRVSHSRSAELACEEPRDRVMYPFVRLHPHAVYFLLMSTQPALHSWRNPRCARFLLVGFVI